MNRKRELMASVVTAVAPSGSMTMTEYNPYNMALGLFGAENVHKQEAKSMVDERYIVPSVPGIIELKDADGNRLYNADNIIVSLATAIPSKIGNDPTMPNVASGSSVSVVGLPASSMVKDTDLYVAITKAANAVGNVEGLKITWREGIGGSDNVITVSGSGATTTEALGSTGISVTITLDGADDMSGTVVASPISGMKIECIASKSDLKRDVDYVVEEQSSRAGFIKIPEGSVLNRNDEIRISADIPESDFVTVSGGNAGEIEGELVFIGDPNQGDIYNLEAWKVKIQPDGDLTGLIGTDFGSFTINVKFLADYKRNRQYPYYRLTKVGSASGTEVTQGVYDPLN